MTLGNFAATSMFEDSQSSFFTGTNPTSVDGVIDSNITETIDPGRAGRSAAVRACRNRPRWPWPASVCRSWASARWVRRKKK